jgi:hypothetical protein
MVPYKEKEERINVCQRALLRYIEVRGNMRVLRVRVRVMEV